MCVCTLACIQASRSECSPPIFWIHLNPDFIDWATPASQPALENPSVHLPSSVISGGPPYPLETDMGVGSPDMVPENYRFLYFKY